MSEAGSKQILGPVDGISCGFEHWQEYSEVMHGGCRREGALFFRVKKSGPRRYLRIVADRCGQGGGRRRV